MDDERRREPSIPVTAISSRDGFLLAPLLLFLLLVPPLLVQILLWQGFYLSLEFLPIWLIVMIEAFM